MLSTGRGEPRKVNLGALCKRNIGTEANVKLKKKINFQNVQRFLRVLNCFWVWNLVPGSAPVSRIVSNYIS